MSFDDETTEDIEIEGIEAMDNAVYELDILASSYYDYNGPQQPKKPAILPIPETLREERRSLGRCVKCGELLGMSIFGLTPCGVCK